MTRDLEYRYQIEGWLGRSLTDDELVLVGSVDKLSAAQEEVLIALARRNRLAAVLFLRGVVHELISTDALAIVDRIRDTPVPR